jgi:hypothetical protein
VQALDLVARKVLRDGGAAAREFFAQLRDALVVDGDAHAPAAAAALDALERVTAGILARGRFDPEVAGAVSTDYLELFGLVTYACLWSRMAAIAPADEFGQAKRATAAFYFARLLPRRLALETSIEAPPGVLSLG